MSRLLLGPSTRSTTVWIAFDSMDGGCTSVGPFGLSLMDVRSPHAVLASSAARTLRIWCLMIVLRFPSGSRPHGQGEADAARGGHLAVFDALPVPASNACSRSTACCFAQTPRVLRTS